MEKYFTCTEIASMYKVSVLTVWAWIRKKKLHAIKIGKEYRVRQEDIDEFESKRKTV